jgi:hypothetical protein
MGFPVRVNLHSNPHFDFITWLGVYRLHKPGVQGGDNATFRLDEQNEPQPDAFLRILPECGGQSRTDETITSAAGPSCAPKWRPVPPPSTST